MTTTGGRGPCRVCGKSCALRWDPDAGQPVTHPHGHSRTSRHCSGSKDAPAGKPSVRTLMEVLKTRPEDQPLPTKNDAPYVQDQVMAYIERRKQVGISRYGIALQPNNGRDALVDLFEELVDAVQYCAQLIIERDGKLP